MSIPFSITNLSQYDDESDPRRRTVTPVVYGENGMPMPAPPTPITPALPETTERETLSLQAAAPQVVSFDREEAVRAATEDPFGEQPARHAAYLRWQQLPEEQRKAAFEQALDEALTAEGITDPGQRTRWKQAMVMVARGDSKTPGENPDLNPYAQAYDWKDRPAQGINPRLVGTPQGDATASSARGYFQFLTKPNGQTPSTWDLVRLPSREGEEELSAESVFDPVSNARGYIRAVQRSSNYQDPLDPWREKQRIKVWNPMLPLPPGLQQRNP